MNLLELYNVINNLIKVLVINLNMLEYILI